MSLAFQSSNFASFSVNPLLNSLILLPIFSLREIVCSCPSTELITFSGIPETLLRFSLSFPILLANTLGVTSRCPSNFLANRFSLSAGSSTVSGFALLSVTKSTQLGSLVGWLVGWFLFVHNELSISKPA